MQRSIQSTAILAGLLFLTSAVAFVPDPAVAADIAASYRVDGTTLKKNLKKYEGVSGTVTVRLYDDDACSNLVQADTGKSLAADFLVREEMKSRGGIEDGAFSNGSKKPAELVYVFDDVDLSGVAGDALYLTVGCDAGTDCPIETALAKTDGGFGACQPVAVLGAGATAGPAGPCFGDAGPPDFIPDRYVDCGNGTVTDTVTGLIWLKAINCFVRDNWFSASAAAAALADGQCGLTDGSKPGDWRLPTKAEWEATIARALALGCPGQTEPRVALTDRTGLNCFADDPDPVFSGMTEPAPGESPPYYSLFWSSTADEVTPSDAWSMFLRPTVGLFGVFKDDSNGHSVWPVRVGR